MRRYGGIFASSVSVAILIFFGLMALLSSGCSKPRANDKMEGAWVLVQSVWAGEKRNSEGLVMEIENGRLSYDGEFQGDVSSSGGNYRLKIRGKEYLGRFVLNGDYMTTTGNPKPVADGGIAPTCFESTKSNGYRWALWRRVDKAEPEDDDTGSPAGLAG